MIAIQILWVNLATDGLPAIALAADPAAPDMMKRHPRPRKETIFTKPVVALMVLGGIWVATVTLGVFAWALNGGKQIPEAQGICFMTLNLVEFVAAFAFRSDRLSLFQIGVFKNRWLIGAVLVSFGMTLPLLYVPFLREVFNTYPLTFGDWAVIFVSALTILPVLEVGKMVIRRMSPQNHNMITLRS